MYQIEVKTDFMLGALSGLRRIELNQPVVLIGPNNCGKTTAIQVIALWSQAVKTWRHGKGEHI